MAPTKAIVLITGANSGVGFGLASLLVGRGSYHVLLGARSVEKGNAAVAALQSRFQAQRDAIEMLQIDVTSDDSIENAAKAVESKHGRLDVVVNNAAVVPTDGSFREQMRASFDTNATG